MKMNCKCGDEFPMARWTLGYRTCLKCGDADAKRVRKGWTVAPMHKSNYMLMTDRRDLIGINNKGGLVK
tara:strand:+ start:1842 stop:2048 length:207 start_codon:yes stop_codon:yes gene_type:complete